MTQIKLFMDKTPDMESFEKKVNEFLKENEGKIQVRDIKYTAEPVNAQRLSIEEMDCYGDIRNM